MSAYKKFYFRSPDAATFLKDVKKVCDENGISALDTHVLEKEEDGSLKAGNWVDVIPPNGWHITQPTWEKNGEGEIVLKDDGVLGDYALINVITNNEELIALADSFDASDPAKDPVDIPDSEKIGSGTHRIDGSQIDSPARTW